MCVCVSSCVRCVRAYFLQTGHVLYTLFGRAAAARAKIMVFNFTSLQVSVPCDEVIIPKDCARSLCARAHSLINLVAIKLIPCVHTLCLFYPRGKTMQTRMMCVCCAVQHQPPPARAPPAIPPDLMMARAIVLRRHLINFARQLGAEEGQVLDAARAPARVCTMHA